MSTSETGPNESNSSSLASITAIARRIQEKNDVLQSEREHLSQLQQQLSDLQQQQIIQRKQMAKSRHRLLKETRNAANLEMEWMERCASDERSKSKTEQYDHEIQELTARLIQIKKECQKEEEEVYAPHLTKITIYQKTLENNLAEIRDKKRKREEELESLQSQQQRNLDENKRMKLDMAKMEAELDVMANVEKAEDEEIAALAMQIKATLAKRISLRACIEDATERKRVANEETIDWENRLMNLSSME